MKIEKFNDNIAPLLGHTFFNKEVDITGIEIKEQICITDVCIIGE